MRSRRPNPLSVLAAVLVLAGLFGVVKDRLPGVGGEAPCDPTSTPACNEFATTVAPSPSPAARSGPVLHAAEACRDVAYLCAGLKTSGVIQLRRWKGFTGTLVVHVPPPSGVDPGTAQRLQWAATAGIRRWNGQPFPIAVDERGTRPAQVTVVWSGSLGGTVIGRANTQWSLQTGLKAVSLELAVMSPFGSGAVNPDQLRLTAAHEMGHILGLPHSDDPRDVMYPTNTATSLTARDHRALEALYEFEDGTEIVR